MDKPDIFVFTLDCMRGSSTTERTAPFMRSLPLRFGSCWSSGTWTLSSHASLFSGSPPHVHDTARRGRTLPDSHAILPKKASEGGYETALFSENPAFSTEMGFHQDVNFVDDAIDRKIFATGFHVGNVVDGVSARSLVVGLGATLRRKNRPKNLVNFAFTGLSHLREDDDLSFPHHGDRLLRHVDAYVGNSSAPRLCLSNVLDPHNPHSVPPEEGAAELGVTVPEEKQRALKSAQDRKDYLLKKHPDVPEGAGHEFGSWDEIFSAQEEIYETQIRYTDLLLEDWHGRNSLDDSLVVLVGDHGQLFGEEGMAGHQTSLHPNGVQVPLVVDPPADWGRTERTVDEPVTVAGLGATVAETVSGNVGSTDEFVDTLVELSQDERGRATVGVDGPNWGIAELREDDEYDDELVDRLAVKKVGKIIDGGMTVYESPWETDEVIRKSYELEPGDRRLTDTVEGAETDDLTAEESDWLRRSETPQKVSAKVSKRLEDLGYG
ncbi:MAG: sulfatase-like hydrolase/transferase [Halobacteriales archaeon]|nr:sulfatase-like hydrolase/transferase [Halobacteriales archaeon]